MSGSHEASNAPQKDIAGLELLLDVPLQLSVELGRRRMTVSEVLELGAGAVIELSKSSGEALDIYVNDRLVARGEAVVVGERYGVRVSEILAADPSKALPLGAAKE
jgi:flagellar motor switch protein FliN/FliY